LSGFVAQHAGRRMDLDGEYERGKHRASFRVVVLPGHEKSMTRLCTNLPRTPFSLDLVARLYRFRWQVELLFKEWKSYANLHKFDTANEHVAAGLIWASLCAAVLKRFLAHAAQLIGGQPISTRARGHVLGAHHRRARGGAGRVREHRRSLSGWHRVPVGQRTPVESETRSQNRPAASWSAHCRSPTLVRRGHVGVVTARPGGVRVLVSRRGAPASGSP